MLCGEHYGAPYDLLAAALRVQPDRLRAITARWRRAGYAETGAARPGAGVVLADPGRDDRDRAPVPRRPAGAGPAGAHPRGAGRPAVAASQPRLAAGAGRGGAPSGGSAPPPAAGAARHVPDAEIHWPSIDGGPYAGQVWAIEAELTPKPLARTRGSWPGCCRPMRYAQVVYLTAPAARPVVTRAAAALPARCGPGRGPRPARAAFCLETAP